MTEEEIRNTFASLGESDVTLADNQTSEEVAGDTQDVQETTATETETSEGTNQTTQKVVYTPEELTELIQNDGEIDTSRLSDEGLAVMKAMQRGFTPKLQQAADIRRELEQMREMLNEVKPKAQPKDIYEAYDQDPKGVIDYINNEMGRLVSEDPNLNITQVEKLRDLKQELYFRNVQKVQQSNTVDTAVTQNIAKLVTAIPDIQNKQHNLKKFAIEVMGYTEQELAVDTNVAVGGDKAINLIKRINTAYDRFNAGKTMRAKEVKPKPTVVETPGDGFQTNTKTKVETLKEQALKGQGSFRDYFLAMEEDS